MGWYCYYLHFTDEKTELWRIDYFTARLRNFCAFSLGLLDVQLWLLAETKAVGFVTCYIKSWNQQTLLELVPPPMLWLTSTIRSVWLKTGNFCLELSWSQDLCKNHRFYWERKSNGPEWTRTPRSSSLDVSWSPSAQLHSLSLPALCHMFSSKSFMGETSWVVQWITLRVPNAEGPGLIPAWRRASLVAQTVKNLPANAGDPGLIPGLGRSPGEGNGYPLQYTCRENPINREAWQAPVHGVVKSQTWVRLFPPKKKRPETPTPLSPPCEHTARGPLPSNKEAASPQTPKEPEPWSWTSQPPEVWEVNDCYLSHPGSGVLL